MSSKKTANLSSGHTIPTLGYGTWQSAPGEVERGVFEALKVGYRHLDLAKVYQNQKEAAQGIKQAYREIPGLKRQDIFITSKLWNNSHRPEEVEAALDETLTELELDYLDLYLVHFPVAFQRKGNELFPLKSASENEVALDQSITISDTWRAMAQLPTTKVKSIGVSNFSVEHLESIIKDTGVVPSVNQIERHPRLPSTNLVAYCKANNIHITAYSAFGNNSFGIPLLINTEEVKVIASRLSNTRGVMISAAQVILAWAQLDGCSVIPKSVTPSRIQANFQDIELDEESVKALDQLGKNPQRYNVPATYNPKWDINIFGDEKEKDTTYKIVLKL